MQAYQSMGDPEVRREFTEAHCRRLAEEWFDADGAFRLDVTPPSSRERLWNCFSLLGHGDERYRQLADAIVVNTPVDKNHFEPIAATEVYLRHADQLSPAARQRLVEIVAGHFTNIVDVRFGNDSVNNFSCMTTWFLLSAAQVLDHYEWTHPLGSIPEVYTRGRIRAMGRNALYALAWHREHDSISHEFNSPTYTPISLHALAKIVELVDDAEAKALALDTELWLWREVLSFYHPVLGLPCGPWSRAYRTDVLGHNSQMRILFCYLGLGPDASVPDLLADDHPDQMVHHNGNVPFTWSGPAWQMATTFHLPPDALTEFQARRYPHRAGGHHAWQPNGHIRPDGTYVSVQGTAIPGGEADIHQVQYPTCAVGWQTRARHGHSFPLNLHYPLRQPVAGMADVRSVTAATVLFGTPPEWVADERGGQIEASNFNNAGPVEVDETATGWAFRARPFPEMAPLATAEVSLNSFVPQHFTAVDEVRLNGEAWNGDALELTTDHAVCQVRDAGFVYEVEYRLPEPLPVKLWRWAKFVRFAVFWYRGDERHLSAETLAAYRAEGSVRLLATN